MDGLQREQTIIVITTALTSLSVILLTKIVLYMQSDDYRTLGYLPFSQTELASAVGASRIQVARIFRELYKIE